MLHERGNKLTIQELKSEFGSDDERDLQSIDTVVIHTMYNPESERPYDPQACKQILDQYEVSTHYLVDRAGIIWQLVPENRRAWHAGISQMPSPDGRSGVNSFSVGIECVANETDGLTEVQYQSLAALVASISERLPIANIVGHKDIAPERKTDPWGFDWAKFQANLSEFTNIDRFRMVGPQS